jgi:hypothetical protein
MTESPPNQILKLAQDLRWEIGHDFPNKLTEAIFLPLFTLLEDFGYMPRVAFNLYHLFRKSGAHGKQAISMTMGFGCNGAGVIAIRIIDIPRLCLIEGLI